MSPWDNIIGIIALEISSQLLRFLIQLCWYFFIGLVGLLDPELLGHALFLLLLFLKSVDELSAHSDVLPQHC